MTFKLERALKRAEKYLEILTDFIKMRHNFFKGKTLTNFKLSKNMAWLIGNSYSITEEVEKLGYGTKPFFVVFPKALELYYLNGNPEVEEETLELREFLLRYIQNINEKLEEIEEFNSETTEINLNSTLSKNISDIKDILTLTSLKKLYKNQKEMNILMKNFLSLLEFERLKNFKFSMITMGSILELFLVRYCNDNNIKPSLYNGRKGKGFANYIESAIINDLFGERKRWELVQSHLRDFRNYVHIEKEINSTEIDESWYDTIKPVYESLLEKFKTIS